MIVHNGTTTRYGNVQGILKMLALLAANYGKFAKYNCISSPVSSTVLAFKSNVFGQIPSFLSKSIMRRILDLKTVVGPLVILYVAKTRENQPKISDLKAQ